MQKEPEDNAVNLQILTWQSSKRLILDELEFMFMKHYAPNRCEPSIEALIFIFGGGGGGVRADVNGEVFVKFLNFFFFYFFFFFLGGGGGHVRGGGGGRGRCERRSEVFVRIQKKKLGGSGERSEEVFVVWWGFRVDVNEELKGL